MTKSNKIAEHKLTEELAAATPDSYASKQLSVTKSYKIIENKLTDSEAATRTPTVSEAFAYA